MVDLGVLAGDVIQNVFYLATPPLLWLFLYLLAWQSPTLARATGFGRLTFWLLLPGALLGTFSNLPIVPISRAVLALNVGGGLIPLLLSVHLLLRASRGRADLVAGFGLLVAALTATTLGWVIVAPASPAVGFALPLVGSVVLPVSALGVLALCVAGPVAFAALTRGRPAWHPAVFVYALVSLTLFATFLTTEAAPGVGIVSAFPYYLIAPVAAGLLAVVGMRALTGRPAYEGFALGYIASTFGVLIGADVLRQPPLYAPASNSIYAIGGAGLLDLLYLTGLIALAASFLTYRVLERARVASPPPGIADPWPLTPAGRLRRSLQTLLRGDFAASARESADAALDAHRAARGLLGLPPAPLSEHPWAELGAPPWVDADQRNLAAVAGRPDIGARDAWRVHLTARHLVRLARQLGRRRFGTHLRRSAAFLIDLGLLVVPAVAVWGYLARVAGGSFDAVLASAQFNAAVYGFAAYAFLYFVLAEYGWGTTFGKHLLRLRVRDRTLQRPPALPVVVRDLPKLVPLTIVGAGGAVATLLAVRGTVAPAGVSGLGLPPMLFALVNLVTFVVVGVLVCGVVSVVAIHASSENQRLGDYLAGTWVIQE